MFDLNTNGLFAVHGGADSGDGVAGAVAGLLGFIEDLLHLAPADVFAKILPGLAVMDNLHPLLVHFPIALLSLFFVLDFAGSLAGKSSWRHVAGWLLYCGTLLTGFTVTAGLMAANSVAHGDDVHDIMEQHEHLGIAVLVLAVILVTWRLLAKPMIVGAANTLYLLFAVILCGLLMLTADLGGLMVYGYGVAVKPVEQSHRDADALHEHGLEPVIPGHTDAPVDQGHHHEALPEAKHHHDHTH